MSTARATPPASNRRQRHTDSKAAQNGSNSIQVPTKVVRTQEEDVTPSFDTPWTFARLVGAGAAMIHMSAPYYISLGVMTGLIFGGCCSNVRMRQ